MHVKLFHKRINYLKFILLFLPIFLGVIDFVSSFTTHSIYAFSEYIGLTNYKAIKWGLACFAFSFIALVAGSTIKNYTYKTDIRKIKSSKLAINKVNYYFKLIFLTIGIYKLIYIFNYGYANFFIMARWSQITIGPALYFMIIMFPIILAYDISQNGLSKSNILSLLLVTVLNLMTGYRLLLVYGLGIIIVFNWEKVVKISKYKIIYSSLALFILLIGYEVSRQETEAGNYGLIQSRSSIDSMNRSAPLNTLELIKSKNISLEPSDVFRLFLNPLFICLETVGFKTEGFINTQFNLEHVNEPAFREYLIWRGTPDYKATGFSVSIVSYSYLYNKIYGIILFAVIYGVLVSIGCRLIDSSGYWQKTFGSTLLVNLFLCNESVVGGTTLFVYGIIFLIILFCCVFLRSGKILGLRKV